MFSLTLHMYEYMFVLQWFQILLDKVVGCTEEDVTELIDLMTTHFENPEPQPATTLYLFAVFEAWGLLETTMKFLR